VRACLWCSTKLEPDYLCPRAPDVAVARLYVELVERGLDERDVRAVLTRRVRAAGVAFFTVAGFRAGAAS
jgi:hypothetical protein